MKLKGNSIILRNIKETDLEFLREMINDLAIKKMTVGETKQEVTIEEQKKWFENLKYEKNRQRFVIDLEGKPIGVINLDNIDEKNKSASISIKIGKQNLKNKGYGTQALNLILEYAFERLDLQRIYANVLEYNNPSQKLFIKCGFQIDGIQRKAILKNENFYNLIMFSILKEEFKKYDFKRNR